MPKDEKENTASFSEREKERECWVHTAIDNGER